MIRKMQILPCMARSEVVFLKKKVMISFNDMKHKHILLMELAIFDKVPDLFDFTQTDRAIVNPISKA